MSEIQKRSKNDLCAAGHPITDEACPRCGATPGDCCRLLDELSPKEIRENERTYLAGGTPPH